MNHLVTLDYLVILLFFAVIIAITWYYSRRAGENTGEFFLSGRNLPWYLAGTAMVATTFAADTPLAVTELVAKNGIGGNWLWWNMAIGAMLTVFFFSRLWRRSGIMTDVEFVEFRYSGKAASVLRGFRAVYLGLFMNAIVMGWVHKAMEKIFEVTVPAYNGFLLVSAVAVIIALYASVSGLVGTARTDSFQFVFAMAGTIILAVIVVRLPQVGGLANMKLQLPEQLLQFRPSIGIGEAANGILALSLGAFIAHIGLQWWSSWYPGADPGGGGYIAQRMMSAKDEKHSLFATLWFTIAHYTLRPWPWILVALAALIILPRESDPALLQAENPVYYEQAVQIFGGQAEAPDWNAEENRDLAAFYERYENTVDPGRMYPKLMVRFLPSGLLGMLIAVFLAAYMSTIASQLNWGTSYLINDFYRRFFRRDGEEKHYVLVSRFTMLGMIIVSLLITKYVLTTISGAWEFIINASAGMGLVLILRWFWWRINAWSEISAMIAPLIIYPIARYGFGLESPITLYPIVLGTTIIWLIATFITEPVTKERLHAFYRRVHPGGPGWSKVASEVPEVQGDSGYLRLFGDWIAGVILVYSALFGIGKLLFHEWGSALLFIALGAGSAAYIYFDMKKQGFDTLKK